LLCACSLDQSACPGKQPMKNLTRKTWYKWGAPSFTVFLRFFQHSRGRLCHSLHCGQNIHPTSGVIKSASQLCSLQMHIAPILFPTSVRSKLHLHLLSNPDRPIAHTMKLGRRPPAALPLPPRFPGLRQRWESPNLAHAPEPDGLPSSPRGGSFFDLQALLPAPTPGVWVKRNQ